jgi:glycosyltransferase involved in cell wall biosynthesis
MSKAEDRNGQPHPGKSFRLGVWCDYHGTLTPYGGIGVFVYNLVEGILQLNEAVKVVLLIRAGEEQVVSHLQRIARGRLEIIPTLSKPTIVQRLLRRANNAMERARSAREKLRLAMSAKWLAVRQRLRSDFNEAFKRAWQGNWAIGILLVLGLPIVFLLAWAGYGLAQLTKVLVKTVEFPLQLLDRLVRRLHKQNQDGLLVKTPLQVAQEAQCDVWVIPWVAFADPLPFPSVLFVHDLVTSHYPELFAPEFVNFINHVAPARAAEAILCACLSPIIRDQDLLGVLALPPAKIRMVRPAAPHDFPHLSWERAHLLKPAQLKRPYLFIPAAIRPAKNQQALIEALRILRDQFGHDEWDVVLTGDEPGLLGEKLQSLAIQYRLLDRVHVVGKVDRETLAALFKCAWATIMPTLYEEICFPIYEALHWECPVAFSRIPALVEQYQALGDAMLCFDPEDPQDLARIILRIRDDREGIRARQRVASRALWYRTWKDAGRELLAVFKDAAQISRYGSGHNPVEKSAA